MEEESDLEKLIDDALRLNMELWPRYEAYPPVHNSKIMLLEIKSVLSPERNYVYEVGRKKVYDFDTALQNIRDQPELNVGLLASKSLDLDGDIDPLLVKYGYALHLVWSSISPVHFCRLNRKEKLAYRFFIKHGILKKQIPGYMSGVDFHKDVEVTAIHKAESVYQWDIINQKGDYFAPDFNSQPDCLGINTYKADKNDNNIIKLRDHETYKLLDSVKVLNTIAAKTVDTWSVKFQKDVPVSGGCRQYFNRNEKDKFEKQ